MKTIYRLVKDFPAYRVGNDGSVWTRYEQVYPKGQGRVGAKTIIGNQWKPMKAYVQAGGYLSIRLAKNGKSTHRLVHRLVLESFVGPSPKGHEAAHKNGKPADNRLDNLAWKTKKANQADRLLHGTDCRGEKQGLATITDEQARQILARTRLGESRVSIAKSLGVSRAVVSKVALRKTWRHIHV